MASGTVVRTAQDQPTKLAFYMLTNGLVAGIICPLAFLGGPLLMRAAMVTGGALGALSLTAMCAPSKKYMTYSAPLSLALGGLMVACIGKCGVWQDTLKCGGIVFSRPLAFGPVTGPGMRAKVPSVGKRERGRSEADWSLAVVQLSLGIWDVYRCSSALKL